MTQLPMFGQPPEEPDAKPSSDQMVRLRLIITVKAAPNPSGKYGETVCVAGLSVDPERPGWIRLYPINFRVLGPGAKFQKYQIVSVDAVPARKDSRRESWLPIMDSLTIEGTLTSKQRKPWIEPAIGSTTMCKLYRNATMDTPSLGLIRPRRVDAFKIEKHPGWTPEQQSKIDNYVNQFELFNNEDRTPLQAPRFTGAYHYYCAETDCRGHKQGLLDWEFVVLQRRLMDRDIVSATRALEDRFLREMCAPDRDTAFYVGNLAAHPRTFSVLGVYWPRR